jgi:hypothetical protein
MAGASVGGWAARVNRDTMGVILAATTRSAYPAIYVTKILARVVGWLDAWGTSLIDAMGALQALAAQHTAAREPDGT